MGVNLVVAANTHAHADHITGSGKLKVKIFTGVRAVSVAAVQTRAKACCAEWA